MLTNCVEVWLKVWNTGTAVKCSPVLVVSSSQHVDILTGPNNFRLTVCIGSVVVQLQNCEGNICFQLQNWLGNIVFQL